MRNRKSIGGFIGLEFPGGEEIYQKEYFRNKEIKLSFLKPHLTEYNQFKNTFVPGLSIIDVHMFNSIEEITKMLNQYELVWRELQFIAFLEADLHG